MMRFTSVLGIALVIICLLVTQVNSSPANQQEPLVVIALCSPDRDHSLYWRIYNHNRYAVTFAWEIRFSDQGGTLTIPAAGSLAGETTLRTARVSGRNWLRVTMNGQVNAEVTVNAANCRFAPPRAGATAMPISTPPSFPTEIAQVRIIAGVNLRGGPGTNYPVVGSAGADFTLPVIAYVDVGADRWYLVTDFDGQAKWVSAGFVEVLSADPIPLAATVPAPP